MVCCKNYDNQSRNWGKMLASSVFVRTVHASFGSISGVHSAVGIRNRLLPAHNNQSIFLPNRYFATSRYYSPPLFFSNFSCWKWSAFCLHSPHSVYLGCPGKFRRKLLFIVLSLFRSLVLFHFRNYIVTLRPILNRELAGVRSVWSGSREWICVKKIEVCVNKTRLDKGIRTS